MQVHKLSEFHSSITLTLNKTGQEMIRNDDNIIIEVDNSFIVVCTRGMKCMILFSTNNNK